MRPSSQVQFGNQPRRGEGGSTQVRQTDVAIVDVAENVLDGFQLPGKPGHRFAPHRREELRHVARPAACDPEEMSLARGKRRCKA